MTRAVYALSVHIYCGQFVDIAIIDCYSHHRLLLSIDVVVQSGHAKKIYGLIMTF